MSGSRAFSAGVIAGLIVSVLLMLGRAFGLRIDFAWILGTLASPRPTTLNWMIGYGIYLIVSGAFGIVYAGAFAIVGRANWRVGALLGLAQGVVVGLLLGLASVLDLAIRRHNVAAPGLFMAHWGVLGILVLFAACVVFGAVVGFVCGPVSFREMVED